MLSHTIEVKKFLDKQLICDVQVAEVQYELFDRVIKTDKWLRFEEWQELYEKLDKILVLHTSSSANLNEFCSQNFAISNNIEVHIEKSPLERAYRDIFSLSEDEVIPVILVIKVNRIDFGELNKKVAEMERYNKKLQKSQCGSSKGTVKIRVRKDLCREYDPVQESGGGSGNIPPYKPYKPSSKAEFPSARTEYRQEKSEYTPKPIVNLSENFKRRTEGSKSRNQNVPQYIPSEIKSLSDFKVEAEELSPSSNAEILSPTTKNKESAKYLSLRSARKRHSAHETGAQTETDQGISELGQVEGRETRSKRRRCDEDGDKEKCRLSQDLFGSDDSDQENSNADGDEAFKSVSKRKEITIKKEEDQLYKKSKKEKRTKPERIENELKDSKSARFGKMRIKIDGKKGKESSNENNKHSASKENGKCEKKKSKYAKKNQLPSKVLTPPKPKLTEEEQQRNRDNHEKEMEILKTYKEEIHALNKSPAPMEIINLDHLNSEELLATFDEFKPILDKHFKEHKEQKTHMVKEMEDMNHLLTMSIIDDDKLLPLLNHLKNNYEADIDNNVPCYTDLFMTLMLPEWVLNIFMKEHKLARNEAIERIKTQNQFETSNSSIY